MKKIFVGGAVIITIFLILFFIHIVVSPRLGTVAGSEVSHGFESNQPSDTPAPQKNVPTSQLSGSHVRSSNTATSGSLEDSMQEWWQKIHRPIEFYGKVVDQNEAPVEGACVSYIWTQFHPESSFKSNTITDNNGLFSLTGITGSGLNVYVGKTGYYEVKRSNNNHFEYSIDAGSEPFRPDLSNPVVFHLKKRAVGVNMITSQHGGSLDLEIRGVYDGSPVRVNFYDQKVGNSGQMELSAIKPRRGETASQWSFRMSIPDGGFIEEDEEFPFEAPESGYQPVVEFNFKAGDTNWTEDLKKSFYIVFGRPVKYGRIDVETGMRQPIYLRYAINPTGSRNLEPMERKPPQREPPPGVTSVIPDYIK